MTSRPTLVIVSGASGSGKTQRAHALATLIGCPAICRDEIKEGMVHAHGDFTPAAGDELTSRTYPLFFDIVRRLLEGGVTLIAEAAFQDRLWRQGVEPLMPLASLRVIQCSVSDEVARARMLARLSEPTRRAHDDASWLAGPASAFAPVTLTPALVVDTTDGYAPELPTIVSFVNAG
ncbi:MAG TPA: AAA family ATPase [Candidatus Limnocylindrales bacterium]|nr:AAA family ATPase [Candidatus Limnocylindrales bacterium]